MLECHVGEKAGSPPHPPPSLMAWVYWISHTALQPQEADFVWWVQTHFNLAQEIEE